MIGSVRLYWKLAMHFKTPLVFLLDSKYKPVGNLKILFALCDLVKIKRHDQTDCDDFAWIYKAEAMKREHNAVGFIYGNTPRGRHAWNCALVRDKITQVDSERRLVFTKSKEYRAWAIIM
jgi:hypothetical protein